jgi:hypothetical protein
VNEGGAALLGRQEPTYLWVPDYTETYGQEVIDLAAAAALFLDPWQQLMVNYACALDPVGAWLCFEIAIVVSRQNGKGSILEALELAWLFLFGDRLIIHSAHLFETSREHFLRMQALITNHDDFRRRVRRMREGRGSEEIELIGGARLKFMTRKGGAGRGFTGDKVVLDEAMYLDRLMMAASLPTLATRPNPQVVYTGSAGMKHSTQLGYVRKRGLAGDDPALMYAEWAADPWVPEHLDAQTGQIVPARGDPPDDPQTWAKVNPGYGIRISEAYMHKEMRTLGGAFSPEFGTERLGIGDWPEDEEAWEVIDKESWEDACDPSSQIPEGGRVAFGLYVHPQQQMGTISVCGRRHDGRLHIEVTDRHRGTAWMLARTKELVEKWKPCAVVVLKSSPAASLLTDLKKAKVRVQSPSEIEYAQTCERMRLGVRERDSVRHLGQPSLTSSVGGAQKREGSEGGWRWNPDAATDVAPVSSATQAMWGLERFGDGGDAWVSSGDSFAEDLVPEGAVTDRGAAGFASVMRASRGRQ